MPFPTQGEQENELRKALISRQGEEKRRKNMDEQKKTCYTCVNCDTCPLKQMLNETLEQPPAWIFRLPNKITQAREAILGALAEVCPLFETEGMPF